jgi:hypothetical protein
MGYLIERPVKDDRCTMRPILSRAISCCLLVNPTAPRNFVCEHDLNGGTSGLPPRERHFHRQNKRKPARCQRMTVSGLTIPMALRTPGENLDCHFNQDHCPPFETAIKRGLRNRGARSLCIASLDRDKKLRRRLRCVLAGLKSQPRPE